MNAGKSYAKPVEGGEARASRGRGGRIELLGYEAGAWSLRRSAGRSMQRPTALEGGCTDDDLFLSPPFVAIPRSLIQTLFGRAAI